MRGNNGNYMGSSEVQALVGAWQEIVGWSPWQRDHRGYYQRPQANVQLSPYRAPAPAYAPPPYAQYREPHRHRHHHHRHPYNPYVMGWQQIVGADDDAMSVPPRNALIDAPGPERAGREVLPMSTGVAILPTQSAQITARPQRVAFRPERVFISAAGTSGGAADWIVNDIKIGNRSQFSQSGDIPGDMFATNAIDGFVSFETAQTAMDVVMVVTYIGTNESGTPFYASIVGTAAI